MKAETAAAIAALAVAVLAMTVAFAQAIQQYLITGQLIRMCDSVVYGKMPGRGHRMWQFSQFRFRVVYSVPQISLRASLWSEALLPPEFHYYQCHLKGGGGGGGGGLFFPLPDLRHSHSVKGRRRKRGFFGLHSPHHQTLSVYSAIPGEAPWVSFSRIAQNACEKELFYDLVDGDADRCPADLPVVPMQVSMRDVVTISLMAGMRCMDASFEKKSLAMEGAAGTIVSSWHPILGAIIRYSPRNLNQSPGLRVLDGSINSLWMSRMWDVVPVAGRPYSLRDRRYYEEYEGYEWVTLSRDRTIAKWQTLQISSRSSSTTSLRRRRNSDNSTRSFQGRFKVSGFEQPFSAGAGSNMSTPFVEPSAGIRPSRYDGDWCFESEEGVSADFSTAEAASNRLTRENKTEATRPTHRWFFQRLRTQFWTRLGTTSPKSRDTIRDPHDVDVERRGVDEDTDSNLPATTNSAQFPHETEREFDPRGNLTHPNPRFHLHVTGREMTTKSRGRKLLDGIALQEYIEEKKKASSGPQRRGPLFLTWPASGEQNNEEDEGEEINVDGRREVEDWSHAYGEMKRERQAYYIERWRNIVNGRTRLREERYLEEHYDAADNANSFSRQSSVSGRTRSNTYSPPGDRSLSRESQRSRKSIYGSSTQYRGRPQTRSPKRSIKSPRNDSRNSRKAENQRGRTSRRASGALLHSGHVAYGEEPVSVHRDSAGVEEHDRDGADHADENEGMKRKQRPVVGFRLDESRNSSMSNSSSADDDGQSNGLRDRMISRDDKRALSPIPDNRYRPSVGPQSSARVRDVHFPGTERVSTENKAMVEENTAGGGSDAKRAETENIVSPPAGSILKPSRDRFPEDPNPIREGVAPLKDAMPREGIPPGARWTKIDRRLVNPEALQMGRERFEPRPDCVIVLRVLTKEEIQQYADKTREIRKLRDRQVERETEHPARRRHDDLEEHRPNTHRQGRRTSSPLPERTLSSDDGVDAQVTWSNESNFGSSDDLRMSESPSRIWTESNPRFDSSTPGRRGSSGTANSSATDISVGYNSSISSEESSLSDEDAEHSRGRPFDTDRSRGSRSKSSEDDWMLFDSFGTTSRTRSPKSVPTNPGSSYSADSASLMNEEFTDVKESRGEGAVNWWWICQSDVIPGYLATPWQSHFSDSVCLGAITTMLEGLRSFTNRSSLRYVDRMPNCEDWVYQGRSTHPSYAINAMGGIIVSGRYRRVQFYSLQTRIPPIELLRSYEYQVDRWGSSSLRSSDNTTGAIVERLSELMALDSWLAFCGRLPEICDGRNNLLRRMPALIRKIMSDFDYEFRNLDRTATEGGLQVIQEMAELVLEELERESLSPAEQLFTLVAALRSAKMALCVLQGPSTAKLREILLQDIQVYLI